LIAPVVPGTYQGFWNLRNAQNLKFGQTVWVGIKVPDKATPTPPPTQTPAPNISFEANPTTITAGQEVLFKWSTDNVKAVYFYHDGQNWSDHPVPEDGQAIEYPPYTMNYYLHVIQRNDSVISRNILITVNPAPGAPIIEYLNATPPQVVVGQEVIIDWLVSGQADHVALLVNNEPVWRDAPLKGTYPDRPDTAGQRVYTLQATGPGGQSTRQLTVNVQPQQPTVTSETTETPPTPTPTPTTEPTVPVPQPPVVQHFGVAPTTIEQGQSVMASWTTGGGTTRIELLCDGEVVLSDTKLENSVPLYPSNEAPTTVTYTLIAYNNAGEQDSRDATVQIVPAPPQNPLANTSWQLQSMQGAGDVPPDVVITAYFSADGSLSGSGGCNSYTTSYVANGDVITIHAPAGTGALCGDPIDSFEQTYLGLLPQAANFEINGGQLVIRNNGGDPILRYNSIN